MNKIPITDFQEGNCCPKCSSKKIVLYVQYPLIVKYDMRGKKIFTNYSTDKRIYKPSTRKLAIEYSCATKNEFQCANYKCEKCGWISETYTP